MDLHLAYLAQGKLWLKLGTGEAREVESKFGQSLRERAVQIQQRTAWTIKGRGAQFMSGGLLWGMGEQDATSMRVSITGIARGRRPGELLCGHFKSMISGHFTPMLTAPLPIWEGDGGEVPNNSPLNALSKMDGISTDNSTPLAECNSHNALTFAE